MQEQWLAVVVAPLGVPVKAQEQRIHGVVLNYKNTKIWRYSAQMEACVKDVCSAMERSGKYTSICAAPEEMQKKLRDVHEYIELIVNKKKRVWMAVKHVSMVLEMAQQTEESTQEHAQTSTQECTQVDVEQIRTRERICEMCKKNIVQYKKDTDILMPAQVKNICAECYSEYHYSTDGTAYYTEFRYTEIKKKEV